MPVVVDASNKAFSKSPQELIKDITKLFDAEK